MPDRVILTIPSFPRCPTCSAEAHDLTFRPLVEPDGTRVLAELAWRCPNSHVFATAMPDYPLPTWRNQAGDGGADSRANRARDLLRQHFGARVDDLPDILPEMHADIAFTMLGAADALIASLLSDPTDQVVRVQAQLWQQDLAARSCCHGIAVLMTDSDAGDTGST